MVFDKKKPSCKTQLCIQKLGRTSRKISPRIAELRKIKNDKKADIFYIYPTLLIDKKVKDWNADVWTSSIRQGVFQRL